MNKNQQERGEEGWGRERAGDQEREERERDVFSERRPERQRAINVLFSKFWLKEK